MGDTTFDAIVVGRLRDFLSSGTSWNRRLWSVSLLLSLREVLEVSQAVADRILWKKALDALKADVATSVGYDDGVGNVVRRASIQSALREDVTPGGFGFRRLEIVIREMDDDYLNNWRAALQATPAPTSERVARAVASHLLDGGYSLGYLGRWIRDIAADGPTAIDVLDEANHLAHKSIEEFEVLIPLLRRLADADSKLPPPEWRDARDVATWLRTNNFETREVRQDGAFLFSIKARDAFRAAEEGNELISNLQARLRVIPRPALQPLGKAWVRGWPEPLMLSQQRRGVEVDAMNRTGTTFVIDPNSNVDAALDLLSGLDQGPPGTAAATAWAAIESVLIGPGDSDHGLAAERCCDIVLCAWPRAELISLVRAYMTTASANDRLREALAISATPRDAAQTLERAMRSGTPFALADPSDEAARQRVERLLQQPNRSFPAMRRHISGALRRLFRQRNLVLHSASSHSIALRPGLRAAAPLVARGMNTIAHSRLRRPGDSRPPTDPITVAATAAHQLSLVSTDSRLFADLLAE